MFALVYKKHPVGVLDIARLYNRPSGRLTGIDKVCKAW